MAKSDKPAINQQVFEMRYERGYRYLDRTGEVLLILEDVLPNETGFVWMPDEVSPKGARLKCPDLDLLVAFDSYHLVIEQSRTDKPESFAHICAIVTATITARFDLREYIRLGYRRIYLIAVDSADEADQLSVKLSPVPAWRFPIPTGLELQSCEIVGVFETADRGAGVRVAVRPSARFDAPIQLDQRLQGPAHLINKDQRKVLLAQLERASRRQKTPVAGLAIDVDCYENWPPKIDVAKFMADSVQKADEIALTFSRKPQ